MFLKILKVYKNGGVIATRMRVWLTENVKFEKSLRLDIEFSGTLETNSISREGKAFCSVNATDSSLE